MKNVLVVIAFLGFVAGGFIYQDLRAKSSLERGLPSEITTKMPMLGKIQSLSLYTDKSEELFSADEYEELLHMYQQKDEYLTVLRQSYTIATGMLEQKIAEEETRDQLINILTSPEVTYGDKGAFQKDFSVMILPLLSKTVSENESLEIMEICWMISQKHHEKVLFQEFITWFESQEQSSCSAPGDHDTLCQSV